MSTKSLEEQQHTFQHFAGVVFIFCFTLNIVNANVIFAEVERDTIYIFLKLLREIFLYLTIFL